LSLDLSAYAEWSDLGNAAGAPVEAMAGGWYRVADALRVSAGFGHGITSGVGASNGRAVLGLSWEPKAAAKKPDAVAAVTPPKPPKAPTEPAKPTTTQTPATTAPATTAPANTAPATTTTAPATAAKVVPTPTSKDPVVVSSNHMLLYQRIAFDGASLRDDGAWQLDGIVRYLANHPEIEMVRIEGHTDGRGDPSDELALSGTRAGIVLEYLVKKGLARERFYAAGYGGMRPVAAGTDEAARVQNERIEFVVTKWAEGHEPE
jgi:outer membrane protein OmpA-like peptidoglycan-associated protein